VAGSEPTDVDDCSAEMTAASFLASFGPKLVSSHQPRVYKKGSWYAESHLTTPMMKMERVSETLAYLNHLMMLCKKVRSNSTR
jgi:hypothetical protein